MLSYAPVLIINWVYDNKIGYPRFHISCSLVPHFEWMPIALAIKSLIGHVASVLIVLYHIVQGSCSVSYPKSFLFTQGNQMCFFVHTYKNMKLWFLNLACSLAISVHLLHSSHVIHCLYDYNSYHIRELHVVCQLILVHVCYYCQI